MPIPTYRPLSWRLSRLRRACAILRTASPDPGRSYRPEAVDPWLAGPAAEGLAGFAQFGSLAVLTEVVESAQDEELEAARATASVVLLGLSFTARLADAIAGRSNVTGMNGVPELLQGPETGIWMTALFVSLGRSPAHAEGVRAVREAIGNLREVKDQVAAVTALAQADPDTLGRNLARMPFRDQAAVRRVIRAFLAESAPGAGSRSPIAPLEVEARKRNPS